LRLIRVCSLRVIRKSGGMYLRRRKIITNTMAAVANAPDIFKELLYISSLHFRLCVKEARAAFTRADFDE
jgi:hypothetical protein